METPTNSGDTPKRTLDTILAVGAAEIAEWETILDVQKRIVGVPTFIPRDTVHVSFDGTEGMGPTQDSSIHVTPDYRRDLPA